MRDKRRFSMPQPMDPQRYDAASERSRNVVGAALLKARKALGLSREALAARLGLHGISIQQTGIYRWEAGDSIPNAYQLLAVCQELGIDDLFRQLTELPAAPDALNDEGIKKLAEYRADLVASGRYRIPDPAPSILYVEMPYSTLAASAGGGEFLSDEAFETIQIPAASVPPGADFCIRVNGDSMEPIYQDGQLVWVRRCQELREGDVGLFIYDGNGYIKVYGTQSPPDEPQDTAACRRQPVLISYNQRYAPKPISPELPFSVVGKILS